MMSASEVPHTGAWAGSHRTAPAAGAVAGPRTREPPRRPRLLGYAVAVAATLVILAVRFLLWPVLGETSPFVLFILSVLVTARYYGPGPGALATVLGGITGFYFFTEPRYTFVLGNPPDMVRLVLYLLVAAGTNWLTWLRWRSEEALRRSNERLQYLLATARDLLQSDRPAAYVETLYHRLAEILKLDFYLFHLADEPGTTLRLDAHAGVQEGLAQMEELPAAKTLLGDATYWGRGRVVLDQDGSRDPHTAFARSVGATAYAVYPLIAHEHLAGTLAFGARGRGPFDPDELALMETVCDQAAIAVDRARLIATLQQRAEELSESDRHKSEFLAMLAHELRNPLAPIRTAAEILRLREGDTQALRRSREVLERQVAHMTRLLDDLLDISRIGRGKIRLSRARVELGPVLEGAVEACRPLIAERAHALHVSLPAEPVWVDADVTRLHQVITNLLTNAAKYTDAGGRIELYARQEGRDAVIQVTDTGIGIAPEMLPRVFDLFSQAEHTLDRSEGGLGIGLSLVRTLVELHMGAVSAWSEGPGHGSRFTVRLPALAPHADAGHAEPAGREPARPAMAGQGPVRVLVVDDNADARESLTEVLDLWGCQTASAPDGPAALEAIRSVHPQVVLLDVGLPGMDGYELARRLRGEPGGDALLLAALTGYGQPEDRQRSREAGINHHLTKPVDLEALRGLLTREDAPPA